jgi:hypothetical protein
MARAAAQARRSVVETRSPTSTGLALGHDHAGIEPRHVQEVADKAVEPLGLAQRRAQKLLARRLVVALA